MITYDQAAASIGSKVVYRAPHVLETEPGEEGVITKVTHQRMAAFVRYGSDTGSKFTPLECLTLVSKVPRPTSSTHMVCPSAPYSEPFATHHLVPVGVQSILTCSYCGQSDAAIRDAAGL